MFFRRKTKDESIFEGEGVGLSLCSSPNSSARSCQTSFAATLASSSSPLAHTSLFATPSSRGSNAAPATPRFMHTSLVSLVLIAAFVLAPASFAQQNTTVDAVKKRAELNSAKADLEEVVGSK